MKLKDIKSAQLLPAFADGMSWMCNAFDSIVKPSAMRVKSLLAPLTSESLSLCTDAEIQGFYEEFGLARYYPDISRARQEWMLLQQQKCWNRLGTTAALKALVQYIFDDVEIDLTVYDNLAFNDSGILVDEDKLNLFSIEVTPSGGVLPENAMQRVVANVYRFIRNTQALESITYTYESEIIAISSTASVKNGVSVERFFNS